MNPQYTCPRCGYKTKNKTKMYRHLYEKQKVCAGCVSNIELTEDVKECILENRVYKKDPPWVHHESGMEMYVNPLYD